MKMKKCFNGSIVVFVALLLLMSVGGFESVSAKTFPALETPAGANDEGHNAEGIKHYNMGAWDKAAKHFRGAVKAAPKMAEAHYNLALSLDKLRNHREATKFFASAMKLAPNNPAIKDSKILKDHLGM